MCSSPSPALDTDIAAAILRRLAPLSAEREPFPHIYQTEFFPPAFYQSLLAMLPPDELLSGTVAERSTNPYGSNRRKFKIDPPSLSRLDDVRREFWSRIASFLCGREFVMAAMRVFQEGLARRYGSRPLDVKTRLEINIDQENYAISPHTDAPQKICTMLFYLPSDDSRSDLGTSIYVPRDRTFRSEQAQQYPFENFETVRSLPFVPNSAFAFLKTDTSFHGRPPVEGAAVRRQIMTLSIQHRRPA